MITSAPLSSQHHAAFRSSLLFVFIFSLIILPLLQTDSTSGPLLLAGYEDGSLLLWEVTQRSKVSSAKAHPEPVMCLTFDTERLRGISGSSEKKLASWILDRQQNLQVSSRNVFRGSSVVWSVKLLQPSFAEASRFQTFLANDANIIINSVIKGEVESHYFYFLELVMVILEFPVNASVIK